MKEKVKFLVDVKVLKGDNGKEVGGIDFEAKAGEVKELSTASAKRWYKREKAIPYTQGSKSKPKAAPKPEPEVVKEVKEEPKKAATESKANDTSKVEK
jgi:hypothetical protein